WWRNGCTGGAGDIDMSDPFIDAYSAIEARMKIVDVITNNLANANTTGFKRDFGIIMQNEIGTDAGTQVDVSPGDVVQTGNATDVALNGPGFLVVQGPNGIRYTRAGNFGVNSAGELVTKDSLKVLSTSGSPIEVGEGNVEIRDGGVV